jgi:hypothetical protein
MQDKIATRAQVFTQWHSIQNKYLMLYYYIMVDPDKPDKCKLGITQDPRNRMRAYKTAAPNAYFLQTYVIPDRIHERRILETIRKVARVQSEYVHCAPSFVRNVVESYFMDNNIQY